MHPDKLLQMVVAVGVLLLMGFCLVAVALLKIPASQMILFSSLASGVIGAGLGSIVGFNFGSSLGSQNKTQALIDQAKP